MSPRVPIDKTYLRHLLVKHKNFLKKFYEEQKKANLDSTIEHASANELNILIRIVYLVVQEAIPLDEDIGSQISPPQRKLLLKLHAEHDKISNLLKAPLNERRHHLMRISKSLPLLLTPLFQKYEDGEL